MSTTATATTELTDLLSTLATHRGFLRYTVRGLTDEQARLTPTASELSLGGLVKHVTLTERSWIDRVAQREHSATEQEYADGFVLREDETLAGALAAYDEAVAAGRATLAFEGEMVDEVVAKRARATLALAPSDGV